MLSSAAIARSADDRAYLQHMLEFEPALARAEAANGVIPGNCSGPDREGLPQASSSISLIWARPRHARYLAIPWHLALPPMSPRPTLLPPRCALGATSRYVECDTPA